MVCVNIDQGVCCRRMRTPFVIINEATHFFIPTSIPFKPPPLHIVNKCYITCEAQLVKVFTYSIISLQATDTSLFRRVRDRCLIDWYLSCAFLGVAFTCLCDQLTGYSFCYPLSDKGFSVEYFFSFEFSQIFQRLHTFHWPIFRGKFNQSSQRKADV